MFRQAFPAPHILHYCNIFCFILEDSNIIEPFFNTDLSLVKSPPPRRYTIQLLVIMQLFITIAEQKIYYSLRFCQLSVVYLLKRHPGSRRYLQVATFSPGRPAAAPGHRKRPPFTFQRLRSILRPERLERSTTTQIVLFTSPSFFLHRNHEH